MMDKKDVIGFFSEIRRSVNSSDRIDNMLEELDIVMLDVSRMYRILDKFSGEGSV
jgi:hypothetical protein